MSALRLPRRPLRLSFRPTLRSTPRLTPLTTLPRFSSSNLSPPPLAPAQRLGQPHHTTHPHLLKPTELTPHLTPTHYALRRAQFASLLPPNSIAILPSHSILYRSGPVFHEFHQHPDLFYLTGFLEPSSVCVIEKLPEHEGGMHYFHLFCREKNPAAELWDGARTGIKMAEEVFMADRAHDVEAIPRVLPGLVEGKDVVYSDIDWHSPAKGGWIVDKVGGRMKEAMEGIRRLPAKPLLHQLRIVKSGEEATIMREAGRKSGRAYNRAFMHAWKKESELAAYLEYWFKMNGCEKVAYVPVVAGGKNALAIHYTNNDQEIKPNDLILVDAAGQYGGYCADITRTFPASGKFTESQKKLYQAVLNVQKHCVKLCRANANMSLDDIHREAEDGLQRELEALGFNLPYGLLSSVLFPHHVGHYLGIDLHDCATYGRTRKLQRGMVVTIEPGVYVPDGDERFPREFWGMGIRIEDAVYVAEEHPIVLTVEAVKEVVDIEALRDTDPEDIEYVD